MKNDQIKNNKRGKGEFSSLGDLVGRFKTKEEVKYVSREFQQYGYDLAQELNDMKHKSLYIKMAKVLLLE